MKQKRLECVKCGLIQPIWRKDSKNKLSGHLKHIWCPSCEKKTVHIELDEFAHQFEKNIKEMTVNGGR